MSFTSPTERGGNSAADGGTTLAASPTAAIAVGQICIVSVCSQNPSTGAGVESSHITLSDTDGHTWTKIYEYLHHSSGGIGNGFVVAYFATVVTSEIGTGDSITATWDTNGGITTFSRTMALLEVTGNGFTNASLGAGAFGFTAAPSVTSQTGASAERLWLGTLAISDASPPGFTADTDYTGWGAQSANGGSDPTSLAQRNGYRIATATADTYNPTMGGSRDTVVAIVALEEAGGGGATTTVSIDQSDPQSVEIGSTLQLSATVTDGSGSTTWASDDEAVATVDATGLVTGVGTGSCTITATNNGVSDSITLNVTAAVVESEPVTADEDEAVTITATLAAHVSGTISLSGSPAEGALVRLIDDTNGAYVADTLTSASGGYNFGAAAGVDVTHSYTVAVSFESGGTEYVASRSFITPET